MHQVRYRALIALDSVPAQPATVGALRAPRHYVNHTHALMIRACCMASPDYTRCFPAELCWDDEQPLRPGDRAEVTITMTDDEAPAFFGCGQRFSLWNGVEIGHGTISRKVYSEYGPC